MTRSHAALGITHLIGNALLLWLGYCWLGMAEGNGIHLAGSAAVFLLFGLGALWLHATALAFFAQTPKASFAAAARTALRRLPWLFALAIVVVCLYMLLSSCYSAFDHSGFVIGSWLTMTLRKPVPPARVLDCYHALIWILRWIVVPALALPIAAHLISKTPRIVRRWPYWLAAGALLFLAVWVPLRLLDWVPRVSGFSAEVASFVTRIGAGYLLFVAALLALEFLTSAGKPRSSQSSTAASP
jgi:hypothetical protein